MDTPGLADSPQDATGGIAEGEWTNPDCTLTGAESCVDADGFPVVPADENSNHWMQTDLFWIYWKMRPAKGAIDPKSIRAKNGPVLADLSGFRESVPTFQGDAQSDGILLDRFDDKIGLTDEEKHLQSRIKKEQWTGPTYFLKKLKEPVKRTEQEHDVGGSKPTKSSPSSRGDCSP